MAAEQDPVARANWREEIGLIPSTDLVFVDETSSNTAMARRYGRSPRGERVRASVPRNYGLSTTLVAALSLEGLGPAMIAEGAIDTAAFKEYVRQLLCPALRPGQVVVVDNLSVHKDAAVRELIESVHCRLLFLPPYSPDFSPIEPGFSKIKESLRAAGARTQDGLIDAIADAIDNVTGQDAAGWFSHCGYPPVSHN